MKTTNIIVNKTDQQPDGVEIELVQPENDLEGRLLSFMLNEWVRRLKGDGHIPYDLPDNFHVVHQGEGTFVVLGFESKKDDDQPDYYKQPQPLAVFGIRAMGKKFDLIHAAVDTPQATDPQGEQSPAAEPTPTEDEPKK